MYTNTRGYVPLGAQSCSCRKSINGRDEDTTRNETSMFNHANHQRINDWERNVQASLSVFARTDRSAA